MVADVPVDQVLADVQRRRLTAERAEADDLAPEAKTVTGVFRTALPSLMRSSGDAQAPAVRPAPSGGPRVVTPPCGARRPAGWRGERAPGEPASEPALKRPRAAHRQLASPERAGQLGAPQVDAVEGRGVDRDLEVDVEPGVLEADRDLGGLEHHPVALRRVAEVELDHRAIRGKLLTIDVAGHPDDQEVGVELLGAGIGERPGHPPLPHRLHDRLQVPAGERQAIVQRPPLGAGAPLDDLGPLERAKPIGEDRARDPRQAALELVEPARTAQHLAHDQERPAVAEDLARLGDRAVLRVAPHPPGMLAPDAGQVRNSNHLVRNSV